MSKYDIYFKLELVSDEPEDPELDYSNTDIFGPDDVIMTAWYNARPFMLDRELTVEFPDLKSILSPFNFDEPCEGTITIYNPSMTIEDIASLLKAEGYSVDCGDFLSEISDED